jgi:hypothetical protein
MELKMGCYSVKIILTGKMLVVMNFESKVRFFGM